jgi:hypothetical protein
LDAGQAFRLTRTHANRAGTPAGKVGAFRSLWVARIGNGEVIKRVTRVVAEAKRGPDLRPAKLIEFAKSRGGTSWLAVVGFALLYWAVVALAGAMGI